MSETVLGASDSGGSVELAPGDAIRLELQENLSTGYSWQIVDAGGGILRQAESSYVPPAEEQLGAPGTRRFRFLGAAAGTATLKLELRRPWEPSGAAADQLQFRVTVRES